MKRSHFSIIIIFASCIAVYAQTPVTIEKELHEQLDIVSRSSFRGGEYNEDKVTAANDKIRGLLTKFGNRSDVLAYPFDKLKNGMFIATSKDGRLRVYSWDYGSSGTMRDFAIVYQFRGKSGRVHVWAQPSCDDFSDCGTGSFIEDLFQVRGPSGTVYLPVSTGILSTSLCYATISIILIDGEKLNRKAKLFRTTSGLNNSVGFEYDFFSVVDRPERPVKLFHFDEANGSFRFPVVIEDEKTPQGRVTDKFITYSFNGKYFVRQH